MKNENGKCPLDSNEIISQFFIENRSRILEIAAFLDRIDRAKDANPEQRDFRIVSFYKAISELLSDDLYRVDRIHQILSDQSEQPLEEINPVKTAWGAPQGHCC